MSELFKDICRIAYAGYVPQEQIEAMLKTPPEPSVWAYEDYNEYLDALTDWKDKYDPEWRDRIRKNYEQNGAVSDTTKTPIEQKAD